MPNWCDTTYKCVGSEKEIQELYDIIKELENMGKPLVENGFGKLWLGCLVTKLGGDWEKLKCRGEITYYELLGENILLINQETAWCEQEGVRQIIEQRFPSIKVYYFEEEPGCEVFYTNDASGEYFPDRYYLDCYDDPQYFGTIEEASKYVSDLVKREVEPTKTAIKKALSDYAEIRQENDECVYYGFHEFEVLS